jgi:hypothetical protein
MSLDARVKGALERSSQIVDPDVRRDLSTVRRKRRRLALRQRITATLVAAALIAIGVFLAPRIVEVIRNQRKVPANPPAPSALVGTYVVDLSGAGGSLASSGVDGRWDLTLAGDGSIVWNPPPGSELKEFLPRDTYQVSGTTLSTNLFARSLCSGSGIGTYGWVRSEGTLTFLATADDCAIRRAMLTAPLAGHVSPSNA